MKKIKKIIFLLVLLTITSLVGCSNKKDDVELSVLTPAGIPSIALGNMFDDSLYTFTTVNGTDLISSNLISGNEYDIIVAPIIMGAQLYTKDTLKYQLTSILTLGNSYLVCKEVDKLSSLKDLEGETIASYGQNTAPDIILKAALAASGVDLDKVTFVYETSVADVFTNRFMTTDPVKFILSAEPVISKMEIKKFNGNNALTKINLQDILSKELEVIPQAGIFVKKGLEKDISTFLEKINNNVLELNTNTNEYSDKLLSLTSENKSIFEALTKEVIVKSIPGSNINYKNAIENKAILNKYFNMINTYNSKILGGKEIGEAFYY